MNLGLGIKRFLGTEDASATVEFVIVFPIILFLFVAAFESSMLLTRQVIMEKALDGAVRTLRLTSGLTTTHAAIRQNICDNTPLKQGKFSPGVHIPIFSEDRFRDTPPDYAFLAAWNHEIELRNHNKAFEENHGRWITHVPEVHILD